MTRPAPAPFHADLAAGPPGGAAWWVRADDGVRVRFGHWPCEDARGTVLLMPGRTEYVEKYGHTAADLVARGFAVLAIDWRGQGLADRLTGDPMIGHVGHFRDYQRDLAAVLAGLSALDLPPPEFLLAHSMGGCIGLRALHEGLPVRAAVFSAPMWGIRISGTMRPAAWALSWGSGIVGRDHRLAPGTSPDSYVATEPFDDNQLTRDRDMWDMMRTQARAVPEFALGGPSLRWLHAALTETLALHRMASPDLPCLTFLGTNERIVDVGRVENRMARWPGGRLQQVPGGEHEVLMDAPATRAALADDMAAHFDAARAATGATLTA